MKLFVYDIAKYIEYAAYSGLLDKIEWRIHSSNPVGVVKSRQALEKADSYWGMKDDS